MIISDGVVEAILATGSQYGDAHLAERILATAGLHARDAVEALQRDFAHLVGDRVHDDATFVVLDWHGSSPEARRAAS